MLDLIHEFLGEFARCVERCLVGGVEAETCGCLGDHACCCTLWEANDRRTLATQRGSPAQLSISLWQRGFSPVIGPQSGTENPILGGKWQLEMPELMHKYIHF